MANGIDWFRWHHGSVTDPKFQLVARRAGCRLPDVIAAWAFVLEQASASSDRGSYGDLDFESIDLLMGFDDGVTQKIVAAMEARGLLVDGMVAAWTKRQVKRERTDDSSTERVKAFREKQRQETPEAGDETPGNATQRQETPREEKRREEEKEEAKASLSTSSPEKPMDELFADEGKAKTAGVPSCPIDALLDAYEELLPTLPAPRRSLFKAGKRAAPMRQRWAWVLTATHERGPRAGQRLATNAAEGVEWFRKYFEHVAKSDFLTGRDGKWTGCNIGFLMQLEKFSKVLEGAYHQAEVSHA
ncbi:hypothetical protein Daci_4111 [Delftia acidovorans SPH-1]|uniref:DUF1376 domain-containing protein n=2 Tax=Pseudomonadota TaxID=1224 RepID=A9C2T8_DELAS|nr:hypothetical protein [Delftia acidovorans]ABX36742.1 hypothetical protein Daci_4111 [Delftia acidovorans SPH-1]QPS74003.1 hypothetical protein I6G48_25730 [Delftia acidovorans]